VVFIQLAEHCKQATTETLTTETIFVIVRLTISILIVVGTCHGPCVAAKPRPSGEAAALWARPCESAVKPRHVAAKPRAAKPRVRVSRQSRLATRPAGGHS